MFVSPRFLRLASRFRQGSVVTKATALRYSSSQSSNPNDFPDGIVPEVLDKTHNLSQLRRLLVEGFLLNNEPVLQSLCERHYPTLSTNQRFVQMEQIFQNLHSDRSLMKKIEEGLSVVVTVNSDSVKYLSVLFAETYTGDVYKNNSCLTGDHFCDEALGLMNTVHKKAVPFLSNYNAEEISFISHTTTLPKYRTMGILEMNLEFVLSRLAEKGFKLVYGLSTAERTSRYLMKRFQFHTIAEVMYKDYEHNGEKVFGNVVESCPSVNAMVKFL